MRTYMLLLLKRRQQYHIWQGSDSCKEQHSNSSTAASVSSSITSVWYSNRICRNTCYIIQQLSYHSVSIYRIACIPIYLPGMLGTP